MTEISRRSFLFGATATLAAGCRSFSMSPKIDDNLTVLLADLHVRNEKCYQYHYFSGIVDEILEMDPLPKNIVIFGDLAYTCGLKSEYETSRKLLEKFLAAGINVTIGMGNHDRRSTFLEVWPEYRSRTLVPGKIVTCTNLGNVDLLMLDGLQGTDDRADNDMGPVPGKLDGVQQEWLYDYLADLKRPTILASHFPIQEMRGSGRPLSDRLRDYPLVAGYIYGHNHQWHPYWLKYGWGMNKIIRSLCLPSTGHWGDIGYVIFRTHGHKAQARFVQKDFFFSSPAKPGTPRPVEWDDVREERGRNTICTFRY